jgi:hypothetical protein
MSNVIKPGVKEAKRAAREQQAQLEKQRQKESLRAAEAEDEAMRRKATAAKGGARASLLATSETGVQAKPAKLGG